MRTGWEEQTGDEPRAVVELAAPEAVALADAVSFYLRRRFGGDGLEVSTDARSLRSLTGVSDRLGSLTAAGLGGRVLVSAEELRSVREALCLYLAERDTESYQSPEERDRLTALRELNEPLGDLLARTPDGPSASTLALR